MTLPRRIRAHYLPLTLLTAAGFFAFSFVATDLDWIAFITDISGYISIVLLAVSLSIGPLNLALRRRNPVSTYLRRDIGIFGGTLAVIHSATGLFVHLRGRMWLYFTDEINGHLVFIFDRFRTANDTGVVASLLIIFLIAISNDASLRALGSKKWKSLQRLSYLMAVLALLHAILYSNPSEHPHRLYWYYLPGGLLVLGLQVIGIWINKKRKGIQIP